MLTKTLYFCSATEVLANSLISFKIVNILLNPLSTNPTKRSNTLKKIIGNFPANYLSVFDQFMGLTLKGLTKVYANKIDSYYINECHF